jgi:alkaline phosphatase D
MTDTASSLSRRGFLFATGLVVGATALRPGTATAAEPGTGVAAASPGAGRPPLPSGLYTLGVASGDPLPDGVVLWTRLAPSPLDGGGMPDRGVSVRWEVAADDQFRRVVRRGEELAHPDGGHSVHADVRGLRPNAEYFYRFRAPTGELSPVGRTRTAPEAGASPERLRFAFASCQNFQDGFYTSAGHLAEEDIAFVAFLGDYIYEGSPGTSGVRRHEGIGEPLTLVNYRNRHAQYKTDPSLQAAHGAVPWIVTFDDHELDNNWADDIPQDPHLQSPEAFRLRRIAALQAYFEHMPLRRSARPVGPDLQLYRRLRFGRLAEVSVLDTRQYRSDQPANLEQANDPARSMTGPEQEQWLTDGLAASQARWNLLANQVMWAQNDRTAGPAQTFDFDNWDGYRAQRRRLLEFFGSAGVRNPVVLTGDRHATWVCDLKPDFDDPTSPVVGAEITGTSMSSGGDGDPVAFHNTFDPIAAESPHWKFIDNRRGYVVCDLDESRLLASLRTVSTVRQPTATVGTFASFVVEDGRPGIEVA